MTDDFKLPEDTRYREISEVLLKRLGPVTKAFEFTPSDTAEQTILCRKIIANTSGSIRVVLADSELPIDIAVVAGKTYDLRIKKLYSTALTASIIGLS